MFYLEYHVEASHVEEIGAPIKNWHWIFNIMKDDSKESFGS